MNPSTVNSGTSPAPTSTDTDIYTKWLEDAAETKKHLRSRADFYVPAADRPGYLASIQLLDEILRRTATWSQRTYLARYAATWKAYRDSQSDLSQLGENVTQKVRSTMGQMFKEYLWRIDEEGRLVDKQLYCLSNLMSNLENSFEYVHASRNGPRPKAGQDEPYCPETSEQVFQDYFYSLDPKSDIIRSLADEFYLVVESLKDEQSEEYRRRENCLRRTCQPM